MKQRGSVWEYAVAEGIGTQPSLHRDCRYTAPQRSLKLARSQTDSHGKNMGGPRSLEMAALGLPLLDMVRGGRVGRIMLYAR